VIHISIDFDLVVLLPIILYINNMNNFISVCRSRLEIFHFAPKQQESCNHYVSVMNVVYRESAETDLPSLELNNPLPVKIREVLSA
jgi:hypothetical protein